MDNDESGDFVKLCQALYLTIEPLSHLLIHSLNERYGLDTCTSKYVLITTVPMRTKTLK
jgi:hypothetical protein